MKQTKAEDVAAKFVKVSAGNLHLKEIFYGSRCHAMMFFVNRLVTLVKCFNRAKADQPWDFTISHYRMVTKLKIMEVMITMRNKIC